MDAQNGHYPLRACLWELTLKCNMHCMHCGSVAGRARSRELTLDECFAVADELVGLGCKELALIGGEVFLYKGWEQIARYASDRGILVNIMTNAYGIGEEEVRQIQYGRLSNVGISVDGLEENHNRIRGRKNSFGQIIKVFDLLNREDVPIAVVTSLLDFNFPDLEELYEFLLSHGVQIWQLQLVNPMGNMAGRRNLILNPDKLPWLIEFIREKNSERRMIVVAADSIGYYHDDSEGCIRGRREPICYWEGCQAGITSFFIDSVGNVKGCGALYDDAFIEGNVREQPLSEIWRDEHKFSYNRAFDLQLLTGRCRDCDVADVCKGGCRASNYFTAGTLYENAFCPHNQNPREPTAVSMTGPEQAKLL
ncbi:MAG: radical SAM protein [Acidobacteriia bacterium]|nr:radical SAM protein [Terriglobia bacterium]